MINACTTSTESQLAALGDLMALLGATASSSGMDQALTDATDWVDGHVTGDAGGSVRRSVWAETLPGVGSQRLMVSRTPLWAVQRMFNGTDTGTATEYGSTSLRVENRDAGFIELVGDAGFRRTDIVDWSLGAYPRPAAMTRPWYVVYEAGWQFRPSTSTSEYVTTSTSRTVPGDVVRAVLLKAAELYQGGDGISSMSVGPLSLSYGGEGGTNVVERLLSRYRRV